LQASGGEFGLVSLGELVIGTPSGPLAITIVRGGKPRIITTPAHAMAAAVALIMIAGQLFRRKSLAAMKSELELRAIGVA
jgi:hypothetical protein